MPSPVVPAARIDLRSDTVTHPTPEMRRAMAEAELGDDVFGDDPTVLALEERGAELTGKEAALFVPSGTMGNLVALMTHVPRGGEIIAEAESHIVLDEAAGHAVIVGASVRTVTADDRGRMDLSAIRAAFRDPDDVHEPITSLIALENTHAHSMGQPLPAAYIAEVAAIGREHGVSLHVDGARLINASVALGEPLRDLLASADSAMFALSKGLACPVGSLLVGRREWIVRARRNRKLVGGGMRQVGVLAAAGLVALDPRSGLMDRISEDHEHARLLADGLAGLPGIDGLDPARVCTNFVFFRVGDRLARARFLDALAAQGVLMVPYAHGQIRAVTHLGIGSAEIARTIEAVRRALREAGLAPVPVAAAS
jgi:threonine aldolase